MAEHWAAIEQALERIIDQASGAWEEVDDLDDTGAHVGVARHAHAQASAYTWAAERAKEALAAVGEAKRREEQLLEVKVDGLDVTALVEAEAQVAELEREKQVADLGWAACKKRREASEQAYWKLYHEFGAARKANQGKIDKALTWVAELERAIEATLDLRNQAVAATPVHDALDDTHQLLDEMRIVLRKALGVRREATGA